MRTHDDPRRKVRECDGRILASATAPSQPKNRPAGQARLGVEPRPLPSLQGIRAFESAARLGSFAAAAQELGTTSASVSYHVRRLERQIGLRLFLRHSHSVELTVPGKLLAGEALDAFATLRAGFASARDADATHLAVTMLPSFGTAWLTPRLGGFRTQCPEIMVEIDLSEDAHDLNECEFDAAVRNGHGRWPGLRVIKLMPSVFTPLCTPSLLAAASSVGDPRAAAEIPLLGRQDWWECWYRARGHDHVALAGRLGTSMPVEHLDIALAVAGHGVAIGSPILFANEIEAGRLVPVFDLVASDGRAFWLVYPAVAEGRAKIVRFRDWLCAEAEKARVAARAFAIPESAWR